MSEKDRVRQATAEAESTMAEPLPKGATGRRVHKSVPVAVRLTAQDAQEIDAIADRLQVPASALIRGWIRQGLAANRDASVQGALDQLEADLVRLRHSIGSA
ncbi:MAG: hypothetical protein LH650_16770 [Chloroflexi bacterium]|nr:hypothetical protein [Chloroflexota bacterium]